MGAGSGQRIVVEVAFAGKERQELVSVSLDAGATVADAIAASGLAARFPGEHLERLAAGVWGRVVRRDRRLRHGDRVELYRPLAMDPREARRRLARRGGAMGRHDGDAVKSRD